MDIFSRVIPGIAINGDTLVVLIPLYVKKLVRRSCWSHRNYLVRLAEKINPTEQEKKCHETSSFRGSLFAVRLNKSQPNLCFLQPNHKSQTELGSLFRHLGW